MAPTNGRRAGSAVQWEPQPEGAVWPPCSHGRSSPQGVCVQILPQAGLGARRDLSEGRGSESTRPYSDHPFLCPLLGLGELLLPHCWW